jgi:cytochrome oxidase Cu insertion factor (SCO1/SenC/PrrC family)
MRRNSLSPKNQSKVEANGVAVAQDDTRLTRRELLSTLCFGLVIAIAAAGIAFATARRDAPAPTAFKPDHPRRLIPFQLTERSGRTITEADVAGKILVVNFVFTSCSLSCRSVNDRMAEIQEGIGEAPDVQLLSLTVDPRSDTPAALRAFAGSFHADPNRWLFLTGEKRQLYDLIETSFVPRSPELESLIPGGFASTDRIMLVDPVGNVCASFNGLKRDAAKGVIAEIETLRKQSRVK